MNYVQFTFSVATLHHCYSKLNNICWTYDFCSFLLPFVVWERKVNNKVDLYIFSLRLYLMDLRVKPNKIWYGKTVNKQVYIISWVTCFVCKIINTTKTQNWSVSYKLPISRPIRRTFPEECYLNSTCVLCAEGNYYFQTYKYPHPHQVKTTMKMILVAVTTIFWVSMMNKLYYGC
jgi:hypothetical protein